MHGEKKDLGVSTWLEDSVLTFSSHGIIKPLCCSLLLVFHIHVSQFILFAINYTPCRTYIFVGQHCCVKSWIILIMNAPPGVLCVHASWSVHSPPPSLWSVNQKYCQLTPQLLCKGGCMPQAGQDSQKLSV